jgi:hypothetical protein
VRVVSVDVPTSPYRLPLVDLRADDAEIGNYAALLDSLNIGLLVFDDDGALRLRNAHADHLLAPGQASGKMKTASRWPPATASKGRSTDPASRFVSAPSASGVILRAAAPGARPAPFPCFPGNGSLRRVLLTLADLSQDNRLATENPPLPTHDPLTGLFSERHPALLLDDEDRRARVTARRLLWPW